jgi:hypothetical protein
VLSTTIVSGNLLLQDLVGVYTDNKVGNEQASVAVKEVQFEYPRAKVPILCINWEVFQKSVSIFLHNLSTAQSLLAFSELQSVVPVQHFLEKNPSLFFPCSNFS